MLHSCGLVKEEEKDVIIRTLNDIEADIRDDKIQLKTEMEDIHMNIESELIKRIGEYWVCTLVGGYPQYKKERKQNVV